MHKIKEENILIYWLFSFQVIAYICGNIFYIKASFLVPFSLFAAIVFSICLALASARQGNKLLFFSIVFFSFFIIGREFYVFFDYKSASNSYTFRLMDVSFSSREELLQTQQDLLFLFVFSLFVFFFSYRKFYAKIKTKKFLNKKRLKVNDHRLILLLALIVYCVSLIIIFVFSENSGVPLLLGHQLISVPHAILFDIATYYIVYRCYSSYTIKGKKSKLLYGFIVIGLYSVTGIKRERVFPMLLSLLLVIYANIKKRKIKNFFLGASSIFILFAIIISGYIKNNVLYHEDLFSRFFDEFRPLFYIFDEIHNVDVVNIIILKYKDLPMFDYLYDFLFRLPFWFLPRSIYPDKPYSSSIEITRDLFPAFGADIPYTIIGGALLYLGYYFFWVQFALLGLMVAFYEKITESVKTNQSLWIVSFSIFSMTILDLIRVGSDKAFFSSVCRLFVALAMIFLAKQHGQRYD